MSDARQVEDAFAQDPQFAELGHDLREHRFGQTVHAPQQVLLSLEQRQGALLAPQVGHRRRQPGGHQRRGVAQAPALGAVGVRQALADGRFLELVEAVQVRRVLAEVRPARHRVGGRHVHEYLDGGAGQQAAKEALEDRRHLADGFVGDGADVARLHAPRTAEGGVSRVVGLLQENHPVVGVADHRAVRQQGGEGAMVGAGDVEAFGGGDHHLPFASGVMGAGNLSLSCCGPW